MREVLLTSEVLVAACALIVLAVVGGTFARRRMIARGKPLTVCAIREPESRKWRFGLARYGGTGLEWFTLGGLSVRPARRWDRTRLQIGAPRPLPDGDRPVVLMPDAVQVSCQHAGTRFDLALPPGPYTALRSWLEASPPGYNVNVA